MFKKVFVINIVFLIVFLVQNVFGTTNVSAAVCPTLVAGNLFKVSGNSAVYLLNANMERMYFPHSTVYKSWFEDYSGVNEIPNTCVDNYPSPSAPPYGVNYRPGSKLVKVQISPSVYVVEPGNKKSKIGSEDVAIALYGSDWASKVVDIADVFWPNYVSSGSEITDTIPHDGMLVKTNSDTNVYYIKDGLRYLVDGTVRGDVQTVSQTILDSVTEAGSNFTSTKVYSDPSQVGIVERQIIIEAKDPVTVETASSIRLTSATGDSINSSITYNGTNFALVWEDRRGGVSGSEIYFAVVDASGNKIVEDVKITNTPDLFSTNPEIVWNGNGYAVVYAEYSEGVASSETVNFVRVSLSGSMVGSIVELVSGVNKPHPSIAWDGSGYGIVYRTPNNQQGKHYFAYVNSTGVIAKYPVKIIEDQGSDETKIMWDGEMFSIVYRQSPETIAYGESISWTVGTYLYRIDKNGNAEKPATFMHGKEALNVIWTGSMYATVEQDKTFSVFNKSATASLSNVEISSVALTKSDLAYNSGDYGFVGVNSNTIYFSEAGANGAVEQSSMILDEAVSTAQSNPAIASNNSSYIIVWSDNRDNNQGSEIYFRKVDNLN